MLEKSKFIWKLLFKLFSVRLTFPKPKEFALLPVHSTEWCWPLLLCKYWWGTSETVRWRLQLSTFHHKTFPVGISQAVLYNLISPALSRVSRQSPPSCLKVREPANIRVSPMVPGRDEHSQKEIQEPQDGCPRQVGVSLLSPLAAGPCVPSNTHPSLRSKLRISLTHLRQNKQFRRTKLRFVLAMESQGRQTTIQTLHLEAVVPKERLDWITYHIIRVLSMARVASTIFCC